MVLIGNSDTKVSSRHETSLYTGSIEKAIPFPDSTTFRLGYASFTRYQAELGNELKSIHLTMFHCVLYQPEIPPNTGNIISLCANVGISLHLIHPLGFELNDKQLKRAGLDYHEWVRIQEHDSLAVYWQVIQPKRLFACSTKGKTC